MPPRKEGKMKKADASPRRLRVRIVRLAGELAKSRCVLVGTIRPRWIAARHGASGKRLGPYYQWTFKEAGKTVTVNLSPAQVKPFQSAIDRQRKVEQLLAEMRRLSRQLLEATTKGVTRRKQRL
jgi:hypothetical protein